jgi:hypothetical protein
LGHNRLRSPHLVDTAARGHKEHVKDHLRGVDPPSAPGVMAPPPAQESPCDLGVSGAGPPRFTVTSDPGGTAAQESGRTNGVYPRAEGQDSVTLVGTTEPHLGLGGLDFSDELIDEPGLADTRLSQTRAP